MTGVVPDLQDSYDPNFQWATKEEIGKASKGLLQMRKHGLEFEKRRNFVKSGELAYKIREILTEIDHAAKMSMR